MLLKWQQTNLFSSLSDNARGLLLLTMPAMSLSSVCAQEPAGGLDQSMASQTLSLSSYTTISSGFPGLLAPRGAQKKKKGKNKATTLAEQIAEEAKSAEYKAFEAFIMANCSQCGLERPPPPPSRSLSLSLSLSLSIGCAEV